MHKCEVKDYYMAAVTYCDEQEDGTLVVGNGEYASVVNFCPFDGYPAPTRTATPGKEPEAPS